MQAEEGVRVMQEAFLNAKINPHWPMYLRNVKQFIKNSSPTFDEHRYGFHSFLELVRMAQRAGLFRLERNRQGILRVFPGNLLSQTQRPGMGRGEQLPPPEPIKPYDVEDDPTLNPPTPPEPVFSTEPEETTVEMQPESESVLVEAPTVVEEEDAEKPARKRRVNSGLKRKTVTPRKAAATAAPKRSRKKASPPPEEGASN